MKKSILAPLCSGLVIPGLGQILNQEIRKGVFLLSAVFVLVLIGGVKLAFVIKFLVTQPSSSANDPIFLMETIRAELSPTLWVLAVLFSFIWVYSVVDAYRAAKKRDIKREDTLH